MVVAKSRFLGWLKEGISIYEVPGSIFVGPVRTFFVIRDLALLVVSGQEICTNQPVSTPLPELMVFSVNKDPTFILSVLCPLVLFGCFLYVFCVVAWIRHVVWQWYLLF
jgi:hypothetical protein